MRLQFQPRRRPVLLTIGSSVALLAASPVFAADAKPAPAPAADDKAADDKAAADQAAKDKAAADKQAAADKASADKAAAQASKDAASATDKAADATSADAPAKTSDKPAPASTEDPTSADAPASTTDAAPTTTEPATTADAASQTDDGGLTNAPTLTRGYGIPSYPPASVPPTHHAPFMQHSSAPDGTVFIAVGAILGVFGVAILLWRVIVGLLLHRSVERAAAAQHDENAKSGFPGPPAPFYKYTDQGSNMSLGGSAAGRGVRRTNRGATPSQNPSASQLFFSPTAAASGQPGANRASTFLPSGFYAAGSASQGHGHSISLTNLRPDSRSGPGAGTRNMSGPTPPDSPAFPPARRDMSTSSLNLGRPSSQRAPSAYLDDLLADDPGALPPPHMPPSTGPRSPSNLGPGSNRL